MRAKLGLFISLFLLCCLVLLAAPVGPAEATITYVGAGTVGDASSGNITPGLPSGWQANDIHIASIESWADPGPTPTMPAGWNLINTGTHVCGGNNVCRSTLYWRRAQAGDTNPLITYGGTGTAPISAWINGFRGVVTTGSPFDGTPSFTGSSGETTAVNAAAISTTVANTMLVFSATISDNAETLTTMPTGSSPWTKGMYLTTTHTPGQDYAIGVWYGLRSGTGTQAAVQLALQTAAGSYGSQMALIPDLTIQAFEQSAYRLFSNADSTTVGAALAAQDTAASSVPGAAFRLKTLVRVTGPNLGINGQTFKLQFVGKGTGTCAAPTGGTPAAYTDVTAATVIAYKDNPTPADGDPVQNVADLTYGGDTIVGQTYEEANNFTNPTAINANQDGKWDFALKDNGAPAGTTYCFRVVKSDGTLLDTYTVIPEVSIRGTIFYFHDVASPNTGTLPGATTLSAMANPTSCVTGGGVTATGAGTNRDMNQTKGTLQASAALTTCGQTGLQKNWFRRFISRPLAAQTLPTGVWTIQAGVSESSLASNMFPFGAVIKVWRPSTGTVVATLLDNPTLGISTNEPASAGTEISRSSTASITGVAVNRGDVLVVELWAQNTQGSTTARTNTIFYDGTTEGSATDNAAYLLASGEITFTVCTADPTEAGYVAVQATSTQATVYWGSSDPVLILQRTNGSGNITGIPTDGLTYTTETIGDAQVIYSGAAASLYQKTGLVDGNTYHYKVFTRTGSGATSCYAAAGTTTVNALHPATAPPAWSYMLGGGSSQNAGITGLGGTIYTSTGAGRIVSLHTADGTQSWVPVATTNGAAIQGWLVWLPIGTGVVVGGDQGSGSPASAWVYSVATATGNSNWTKELRTSTTPNADADVAQATVAAQIKAWSPSLPDDLIFVATANTNPSPICGTMNTNNKVYALKASTGVPQWVFNQSCTENVDVFYGMPAVDYGRNWLYLASRAGGGAQQSFWAIDTTTGSKVACAGVADADCKLGHLETSPTLRYDGSRVYVGDTTGNLYAMDVTANPLVKKWTDPIGFKINGFVWEDYSEAGRLYFSTVDGKVRCRKDTGAAPGACSGWTADSTVAGASTPLLLDKLFVGSTDGNVYQIDPATGGTPQRSFAVPGGGTVGTPSTEDGTQIFVGTSTGKIVRINLSLQGGVYVLP